MTCIQCKREIGPDENYVQGQDSFGSGSTIAFLHDECSERYADRYLRHQRRMKLVLALIEEVNSCSDEEMAQAIVEAVTRSHRTLQQAFWSAIKLAIKRYAWLDRDAWTDLRNQTAWTWCCRVASGDIDTTGVGFPKW